MKVIKTENMTLTLPTNPRASGGARLVYEFSDRIFDREFNKFLKKNKFDAIPDQFIIMLRAELEVIQAALLKAVGESVVTAIRAGGIMSKVAGYANGKVVFKPASGRAGTRIFRIRSKRLSGAVSYSVTGSVLTIDWNTGVVSGRVPGPYRPPFDGASPEENPKLERYARQGRFTPPSNPVAAIESGDPQFQRMGMTGDYGFHPFEGAVRKNEKTLDQSYAKAVRDLFERGVFVYGGRKLSLPVYVDNLLQDSIKDFYNKEVKTARKADPVSKLKSNEASFFSYLKNLFRSNSAFIKSLSFSDVRQIFQKFNRGKTKGISRGSVGLTDSEFSDKFVRDSRKSIQKFLESIEDDI